MKQPTINILLITTEQILDLFMMVQITENEILHLGLSTAGFKDSQRETSITRKLDRFRACYGPMPKTASDIFGRIQEEDRAGVFHIS
jgi:hypothetical protein